MRERMMRDLRPHGPWDVKLRVGGLVDVEFIAQALQLVHVSEPEFRRSQTTQTALRRLGKLGAIAAPDMKLLIAAERLWRTVQGMLRITVGRVEAAILPEASAIPLLRAAAEAGLPAVDTSDLLQKSDDIAQQVRTMFEHYVGKLG
jgi:glutamate-ammonia-ligase adenylyltransferase